MKGSEMNRLNIVSALQVGTTMNSFLLRFRLNVVRKRLLK